MKNLVKNEGVLTRAHTIHDIPSPSPFRGQSQSSPVLTHASKAEMICMVQTDSSNGSGTAHIAGTLHVQRSWTYPVGASPTKAKAKTL